VPCSAKNETSTPPVWDVDIFQICPPYAILPRMGVLGSML
jgi:hypothetical protein